MRGQMLITMSVKGNVDAVLPNIREQMRKTAKDLPMVDVTPEDEQIQSRAGEERSLAQTGYISICPWGTIKRSRSPLHHSQQPSRTSRLKTHVAQPQGKSMLARLKVHLHAST
jgi:hypothetical protein